MRDVGLIMFTLGAVLACIISFAAGASLATTRMRVKFASRLLSYADALASSGKTEIAGHFRRWGERMEGRDPI